MQCGLLYWFSVLFLFSLALWCQLKKSQDRPIARIFGGGVGGGLFCERATEDVMGAPWES